MAASIMDVRETPLLDVSIMCRVCMHTDRPLCQIFDEFDEQSDLNGHNNLAELLMQCGRLPLKRNDNLPQQICEDCKSNALIACRFHSECISTHQKLLLLLGGGKLAICVLDSTNVAEIVNNDGGQYHRIERATQTDCETSNGYGQHVTIKTTSQGGGGRQVKASMKCPVCSRQFMRRDHFRRHLAVVHNVLATSLENEKSEVEMMVLEELPILEVAAVVPQHEMESAFNASGLAENVLDYEPMALMFDDQHKNLLDDENNNNHTESEKLCVEEDEQPLSTLLRHDSLNSLILEVISIDEQTKVSRQQLTDPQTNNTMKTSNVYSANTERRSPSMIFVLNDLDKRIENNDIQVEEINVLEEQNSDNNDICDNLNFLEDEEQSLSLLLGNDESSNSLLIDFINNKTEEQNDEDYDLQLTKLINSQEQMCDEQMTSDSKPKRGRPPKKDKSTSVAETTEAANVKNKKIHRCDVCLKYFTTRVYLLRHMSIHERKRYVCKECSQSYLTRDELNVHAKELGHDKPMLCPECGIRCKTSNILTVHMRRHKGDKPYKCKFCNKGFPRADDARVHEKYHTNEKSHFCIECGKGFQRKYNLTIHMRVHTGERPYKCSHCTQAFAQSNDLKSHIRRHTGERFICDQCGAAFLQYYQIRHHKSTEHNMKDTSLSQRVKKFTSLKSQEEQIELTKAMNNSETEVAPTEPNTVAKLVTATNTSEEEELPPALTFDNNSFNSLKNI